MSAESDRAARWPLPAGPWREGWEALGRAGCIIVTRKRATARAAATLAARLARRRPGVPVAVVRSEEHTSELQSLAYLVCRLLLEKKKKHVARKSRAQVTDRTLARRT